MKTNNALLILFAAFLGWCGTMNAQKAGLEKRMENALILAQSIGIV